MDTKKLLELGFVKRNCWATYDDYYLKKDSIGFVCIFKRDTETYQESFIQYDDDARHMNSKEDFEKVFNSTDPWRLALEIGER